MTFALIMLALVAAAIGLYWKFAKSDFVFDDLWIMESLQKTFLTGKGGRVRDLWAQRRNMRALTNWTYRTDIAQHSTRTTASIDMDRGMVRLRSFVYHGMFAALTFALLRVFVGTVPALIGALAVLVHPQAVPAVLPISGRSSVLCGLFYLASVLAAVAGGAAWLLVPGLLYLGYKSKEEIAFAPLAMLVVIVVLR